ncbi:hypothetical protein HID58_055749 [Brassica napus]|uniref:Uncharacterized protein n=1 Tax=Brassica napus TaxID=3708 RepID=A0ABQ8AMS4_BRANA|nr:hypothetical protein HID58_055749 [Brassica napus]
MASSSSQLVFQSTASALLPPMINALELYVISSGTSGDGSGNGSGSGSGAGGGGGEVEEADLGVADLQALVGLEKGEEAMKGAQVCGSTNEEKKSKLPIIVGVVSAVVFVIIVYVIVAIFLAKRRKGRLQGLTLPTSTVSQTGTGPSPLFGQQTGNEANQSTNEADMGDIDDLIGVNQSYVTQQH